MKKKNYAMGIFLVIVVFGLVIISGCSNDNSAKNNNNAVNSDNKNTENTYNSLNFETRSSESTVTIDLTPKEFENGKLYVDISVNTHSVDLSKFDLTKIVKLEYDSNSISPVSAPTFSGHHSSGTLIFDIGKKELKSFKIIIDDIPDIKERIFEWK